MKETINEAPTSATKPGKTAPKEEGQKQDKGGDPEITSLLIDPSLLQKLTPEQRLEAIASAEVAARAEKRAEERALARALEKKRKEREEFRKREAETLEKLSNQLNKKAESKNGHARNENSTVSNGSAANGRGNDRIVFVSKRRRELLAKKEHEADVALSKEDSSKKRQKQVSSQLDMKHKQHHNEDKSNGNSSSLNRNRNTTYTSSRASSSDRRGKESFSSSRSHHHLTPAQINDLKKNYLGESSLLDALDADESARKVRERLEQSKKKRQSKKITFKFEWDNTEDTSLFEAVDPLYDATLKRTARARESKRAAAAAAVVASLNSSDPSTGKISAAAAAIRRRKRNNTDVTTVDSVQIKPIHEMTQRDWRIYRENFDIRVRGGRAPPPLRSFHESPHPGVVPEIHPLILESVDNVLKYKDPSPIQRQAIPIGLQRRDLIGIAETGSGKTAAFGIPLCHHILTLPPKVWDSVAENGPLALVMAPTRELALQINVEVDKILSCQKRIKTLAVVGGQPIQGQATKLRDGVHVVVGTPGRINDCVEMAYLVLNQCTYIILDEADRMIDLGFAPQIEQILDAMGGMLKSEDESMAYQQETQDLETLENAVPKHRLTAMFSATMPSEVERIAKQYLRHPAVVAIGDQVSGKNSRIVQRVLFLSSPAQKEKTLRDILTRSWARTDKIMVFVNEKKHADGVGRMVENAGRKCVVLHGGKTQDQREENLGLFRGGGVVLVATDVAGRGLDIEDVTHVINFDLPQRSIDNYSHRIGRTGRAGKEGLATSFITDADESIMAPLKAYLESTGSQVPDKLARHPAASSGIVGGNIR
mmetsp:Transcript_23044/g.28256  ORF Transcript_23044/g.28256 Transcript_23044/m.28256 type:complete len:824 (-) Transcript_23044:161-2632(-)